MTPEEQAVLAILSYHHIQPRIQNGFTRYEVNHTEECYLGLLNYLRKNRGRLIQFRDYDTKLFIVYRGEIYG